MNDDRMLATWPRTTMCVPRQGTEPFGDHPIHVARHAAQVPVVHGAYTSDTRLRACSDSPRRTRWCGSRRQIAEQLRRGESRRRDRRVGQRVERVDLGERRPERPRYSYPVLRMSQKFGAVCPLEDSEMSRLLAPGAA